MLNHVGKKIFMPFSLRKHATRKQISDKQNYSPSFLSHLQVKEGAAEPCHTEKQDGGGFVFCFALSSAFTSLLLRSEVRLRFEKEKKLRFILLFAHLALTLPLRGEVRMRLNNVKQNTSSFVLHCLRLSLTLRHDEYIYPYITLA